MSIREIALKFSTYAQFRKEKNLHDELQDEYYDVFAKIMKTYANSDYRIPDDSQIPEIISAYVKSVPKKEHDTLQFRTMLYLIVQYNREIKK